jgi:hypothetical protein
MRRVSVLGLIEATAVVLMVVVLALSAARLVPVVTVMIDRVSVAHASVSR